MRERRLAAEVARELLRYEPETGKLFWKERDRKWFSRDRDWKCWNTRFARKETFLANNFGYKQGAVFSKNYLAHRVIWLMETGDWPENEIDHINHIRGDNRWSNLRETSHKENLQNASMRSDNASGVVGVGWHKKANKWRAQIKIGEKHKHLGYFSSFTAAIKVRKAAELKYGYHANHGSIVD